MAESNSPVVARIVSTQALTQPAMLAAHGVALLGSCVLAVVILCTGALIWLLAESQAGEGRLASGGLLALDEALSGTGWGAGIGRLIRASGWLHSASGALTALMAGILILLPLRWFLRAIARRMVHDQIGAVVQRLRQHIHRKAVRLESADLTGEQTAQTDTLFRAATRSLERSSVSWAQRWNSALTDLTVMSVLAVLIHWRIACETLIPVVLSWFALGLESERSAGSTRLLTDQADRGLQRLAESLRKARIVTGFGMEQQEQQQFEANLGQYAARCRQLLGQQERSRWTHRLILLICLAVPGYLLARHVIVPGGIHLAAGSMVAMCAVVVFDALVRLQMARPEAEQSDIRFEEINDYLNQVPLVSQTIGARFMEPLSRSLQFDQVTLSTSRQPRLLNNLDLRIGSGETVGLLSLNPLAAYSLASMLPRFIDPDSGQVLIDGRDIRNSTLESLRAEAIFVAASDPLFNASVMDNITCGQSDLTRQAVQEACKLVHADRFVRNLDKGYDTVVGEHGVSLDAGQIFRLSLARAVVRKPALLIIEEPRGMLDSETKSMLDDAYQRLSLNRTLIFLPHRLSTVKRCDRVVLIHEGRVAADDSHERLVRSNELYRHWEYINFNMFRDEAEPVTAAARGSV